jgi:signal transduction histidine kinase
MIGELLDISRLEARRMTLEKQPVDLPALVRTVVERAEVITGEHPVQIEVHDDVPAICADPGRLEQILGNLLSNAAKYSYPETVIRVELRRRAGEVQVSVTNEGSGIPPTDLPRLFTRFHRTLLSKEERIPGIGLGLYISKGLVEAHGGHIWAESIPGETTSFRFTLPESIASCQAA